jgi:hypothetical protein
MSSPMAQQFRVLWRAPSIWSGDPGSGGVQPVQASGFWRLATYAIASLTLARWCV